MARETSLLDVDHIEAAAKSTDNITLKHEAGVRRSVADLILAAPCCFDAHLWLWPRTPQR